MSGLEIVILVAGGIYITKKIRERKRQKRLLATGIYPQSQSQSRPSGSQVTQGHGIPQLVNASQSQRVPVEEELLPAYTPPTQSEGTRAQPYGDVKGDLPGYCETVGGEMGQERGEAVGVVPLPSTGARTTGSMRLEVPAAADPAKQGRQRRWKVWKKEQGSKTGS